MTKYQQYYERMVEMNKSLFDNFEKLHKTYKSDQDKYQQQFNTEGEKVVKVIREWEAKLCSHSEKAGFSKFTSSLSEKFWSEVRKHFPLIDYVGVIVKEFKIKKISL